MKKYPWKIEVFNLPKKDKSIKSLLVIFFLWISLLSLVVAGIFFFLKKDNNPTMYGVDIKAMEEEQRLFEEIEKAKKEKVENVNKNANFDSSVKIQEKINLFKNLEFEKARDYKIEDIVNDEFWYNMNYIIDTITKNFPPKSSKSFYDMLLILYRNKFFAQNIIGIKDTFYSHLFDKSLYSVDYFTKEEIVKSNEEQCLNIMRFDTVMSDFCFLQLAEKTKSHYYCNNITDNYQKGECIFKTATAVGKNKFNPYHSIKECLKNNKLHLYASACFVAFQKQKDNPKSALDLVKENKDELSEKEYKDHFKFFLYSEAQSDIKRCEVIKEIDGSVEECEQQAYVYNCRYKNLIKDCDKIKDQEEKKKIFTDTFYVLLGIEHNKRFCEGLDQTNEIAKNKCWDYFYFKETQNRYRNSNKESDIFCDKIKGETTKKECTDWLHTIRNSPSFKERFNLK